MPSSVLDLKDVTLYRNEKMVLHNLNLKINSGENWIILGPNGSGKSSLLTMIQAFLWPQEGEISLMGRRFGEGDIAELRRKIGWVGSDIEKRFNEKETASSLVLSGCVGTIGVQFEKPEPEHFKKVSQLMSDFGISHLGEKLFGEMSQGEKRIICIARALMTEPKLLILDEACAGLDPVARELMLKQLENMKLLPSPPCLIFATHHVEEIREPFNHVLMLKEGEVLRSGRIDSVLTSENLSLLFGHSISLHQEKGRWGIYL